MSQTEEVTQAQTNRRNSQLLAALMAEPTTPFKMSSHERRAAVRSVAVGQVVEPLFDRFNAVYQQPIPDFVEPAPVLPPTFFNDRHAVPQGHGFSL